MCKLSSSSSSSVSFMEAVSVGLRRSSNYSFNCPTKFSVEASRTISSLYKVPWEHGFPLLSCIMVQQNCLEAKCFAPWPRQTFPTAEFLLLSLPEFQSTLPFGTCQVSQETYDLTKSYGTSSLIQQFLSHLVSAIYLGGCHDDRHQLPCSHSSVQTPQQWRCGM